MGRVFTFFCIFALQVSLRQAEGWCHANANTTLIKQRLTNISYNTIIYYPSAIC